MKTFEEEYKELITWYFSERDKIERNVKSWQDGLDGEYTDAARTLTAEYRSKLKALKNKHK